MPVRSRGASPEGDRYVRATLEAIVAAPQEFPRDVEPRLGLYRTFQVIWQTTHLEEDADGEDLSSATRAIARRRLAQLAPLSRQALLLTAMEGFSLEDAALLVGKEPDEVQALVADAISEIERQTRTRVMVIEDEPLIAMDLESIVRDMGHDVTGVAVTRDEAVALAMEERPGLVLADIQLADDSSGIDAVKDILAKFSVPVIFITAFPERLLTGERPEPTLPDHQAVPARNREDHDRAGAVLRSGDGARGRLNAPPLRQSSTRYGAKTVFAV